MKILYTALLTYLSLASYAEAESSTMKCLDSLGVGSSVADGQFKVAKSQTGNYVLWNDNTFCEFSVPSWANAVVVSTPQAKIYFTYRDDEKFPPFKKSKMIPAFSEKKYVSGNSNCGSGYKAKLDQLLDEAIAEVSTFSSTYSLWLGRVGKKAIDEEDEIERKQRIEAWRLERIGILKQCENIGSDKFKDAVRTEQTKLMGYEPSEEIAPPAGVR